MNYCQNCRTELPREARFCTVCGSVQTLSNQTAAPPSRRADAFAKQQTLQMPEIAQKPPEAATAVPAESLQPPLSPPSTRIIQPAVKRTPTAPGRAALPLPKRPAPLPRPSFDVE